MLALPGGAYVYQGEELGLPEVEDLPEEALQDPAWVQSGQTDRGRDGCRVPIPWSGDRPPFGFTRPGSTVAPWLPQPAWWGSHDGGDAIGRSRVDPLALPQRAAPASRTSGSRRRTAGMAGSSPGRPRLRPRPRIHLCRQRLRRRRDATAGGAGPPGQRPADAGGRDPTGYCRLVRTTTVSPRSYRPSGDAPSLRSGGWFQPRTSACVSTAARNAATWRLLSPQHPPIIDTP